MLVSVLLLLLLIHFSSLSYWMVRVRRSKWEALRRGWRDQRVKGMGRKEVGIEWKMMMTLFSLDSCYVNGASPDVQSSAVSWSHKSVNVSPVAVTTCAASIWEQHQQLNTWFSGKYCLISHSASKWEKRVKSIYTWRRGSRNLRLNNSPAHLIPLLVVYRWRERNLDHEIITQTASIHC